MDCFRAIFCLWEPQQQIFKLKIQPRFITIPTHNSYYIVQIKSINQYWIFKNIEINRYVRATYESGATECQQGCIKYETHLKQKVK